MVDKNESVSREHMEQMIATARVETLLSSLSESFSEHKDSDDENFQRLYDADRHILNEIGQIPERMNSCRDTIEKEIKEDIKSEYVSVITFNTFANKITYMSAGAIAVGVFLGWLTTIVLDTDKIFNGHAHTEQTR